MPATKLAINQAQVDAIVKSMNKNGVTVYSITAKPDGTIIATVGQVDEDATPNPCDALFEE